MRRVERLRRRRHRGQAPKTVRVPEPVVVVDGRRRTEDGRTELHPGEIARAPIGSRRISACRLYRSMFELWPRVTLIKQIDQPSGKPNSKLAVVPPRPYSISDSCSYVSVSPRPLDCSDSDDASRWYVQLLGLGGAKGAVVWAGEEVHD